jgi:hypothetical protein
MPKKYPPPAQVEFYYHVIIDVADPDISFRLPPLPYEEAHRALEALEEAYGSRGEQGLVFGLEEH